MVARGLTGVRLVIADGYAGLPAAIQEVLPGAAWQHCRTHFTGRFLALVPKHAHLPVVSLMRSIFDQPSVDRIEARHTDVVLELLGRGFDAAADLLDDARDELLAFRLFPVEHWRHIWSNSGQERLSRDVVRRSSDRAAVLRSMGDLLRVLVSCRNPAPAC